MMTLLSFPLKKCWDMNIAHRQWDRMGKYNIFFHKITPNQKLLSQLYRIVMQHNRKIEIDNFDKKR